MLPACVRLTVRNPCQLTKIILCWQVCRRRKIPNYLFVDGYLWYKARHSASGLSLIHHGENSRQGGTCHFSRRRHTISLSLCFYFIFTDSCTDKMWGEVKWLSSFTFSGLFMCTRQYDKPAWTDQYWKTRQAHTAAIVLIPVNYTEPTEKVWWGVSTEKKES